MDAIIIAGGVPQPDELLYPYTLGKPKALVDVAGKPMVQWVLDAVSRSSRIEKVVIIGMDEGSGVTCSKPLTFLPNQGGMLSNVLAGIKKVVELTPSTRHVLIISSDIPGIHGEMIDWVVDNALKSDYDLYYHVIRRDVMERRYPDSRRTYTRLKDMEVCGGDMNIVKVEAASRNHATWEKLIAGRKNPLKQAAVFGYDTLLQLLFHTITLDEAVKKVTGRLGMTGKAVLSPYAEIGMDVDKPNQLELMRADLARSSQG